MAGPRAASGLPWDAACRASGYLGACTFGPAATERPQAPQLRELLGWGAARQRAEETLELMSMEQKTSLLQGSGWEPTKWWYDLPRFFYVPSELVGSYLTTVLLVERHDETIYIILHLFTNISVRFHDPSHYVRNG